MRIPRWLELFLSALVGAVVAVIVASWLYGGLNSRMDTVERSVANIARTPGPAGEAGAQGPRGHRGEPGPSGEAGSLPAGSIVASRRPCSKLAGDWSEVVDARGRFIIGAGQGVGLTLRPAGTIGGEEEVALTVAQMPKHAHGIEQEVLFTGGLGKNKDLRGFHERIHRQRELDTGTAGEGGPHDNMPPFVALYICERD